MLLWCNHVATYWGAVALQRSLVEWTTSAPP